MLEKLGLPAKPAMRGSAWVVDASHCQSCTSAFSLFNRKHHCRRCGGLFCSNCVQSRMYLRGQGDAPVRICEPCKKVEEAARFEARYGRSKHKKDPELSSLLNDDSDVASVSGTDDSPQVSPEKLRERAEEEKSRYTALKKEGKKEEATKAFKRSRELERKADALESSVRKINRLAERAARPAAVKDKKVVNEQEDLANALKELGWTDDNDGAGKQNEDEVAILGLEEDSGRRASGKSAGIEATGKSGALHMEILGHKRKALALKREGKLAEAKEELKKAKILEKRLEELEMLGEEAEEDDGDEIAALLRSFEKEITPGSTATTTNKVQLDVDDLPILGDEEKDVDIAEEDMTDPDMIAALKAMGWEEEAFVLEKLNSSLEAPVQVEDLKARIQAHKRKALELKRSGNLQEAKKELEEAKSLEQMLEAARVPEDSVAKSVGEQDMQDPHMLAALMEGDDADLAAELRVKPEDKRALQQEILSVKRSALALKRKGDIRGASLQLERAKALEAKMQQQKQLPVRPPEVDTDDDEDVVVVSEDPELAAILKGLDLGDTVSPTKEPTSRRPTSTSNARRPTVPVTHKSKRELQGEILGIKRKALVLRREGKVDEANKELEHVQVLEMQLQALEGPQVVEDADVGDENEDEEEDAEVTEEDMMDPALLAALSAMGFKEDEPVMKDVSETKASAASAQAAASAAAPNAAAAAAADADVEFGGEYGEIGVSVDIAPPLFSHIGLRTEVEASTGVTQDGPVVDLLTGDDWIPDARTSIVGQEVKIRDEMVQQTMVEKTAVRPAEVALKSSQETKPVVMGPPDRSKVQQAESKADKPAQLDLAEQVMGHKRRALALKRQGDLIAAREELRKAKMLEKTATEAAGAGGTRGKSEQQQGRTEQTQQKHQEVQAQKYSLEDHEEPSLPSKVQPQLKGREQESQLEKPSKYTAKERIKLQQQSLGHKRRAMALRREGKADEAEAEYEKAKLIEKQLEEAEPAEDVGVNDMTEDVLDPELLAALASVGLKQETGVQRSRVVVKPAKKEVTQPGREEKVKALKLRALELKRAGKRREALEALQEAKKLEGVL